uniref:PRC-barrel domain-containing protein n=1 Tax=Cyanothece sp. (strain PCC 7425 / ATCC 29141) TaxID=395961 RepID=B8HXP8_CYAP4
MGIRPDLVKIENHNGNSLILSKKEMQCFSLHLEKTGEKIGSITNILIDHTGYVRYLVIHSGFLPWDKKRLLPIHHCQIEQRRERVNIRGWENKQKMIELLEYKKPVLWREF